MNEREKHRELSQRTLEQLRKIPQEESGELNDEILSLCEDFQSWLDKNPPISAEERLGEAKKHIGEALLQLIGITSGNYDGCDPFEEEERMKIHDTLNGLLNIQDMYQGGRSNE